MKRNLAWIVLASSALISGVVARAASTGTAPLLFASGSGSGSASGAFVGSTLDTYYSFFVEVPPSLGRLDVDVFDADVGLGGAAEGIAGRDRARNAFNSTVAYSLRAPDGQVVSTRFTTGSTALPAGADNAWLTFFSSTSTFRDEFNAVAYDNNNGTNAWTNAWTENGDGGTDPNAGDIQIVADTGSNRLRLRDNDRSVQRTANVAGFTSATLSYTYRRVGLDNANDSVVVQVSTNGGTSFTTLATHAGPTNDAAYQSSSVSIPGLPAATVILRFLTSGNLGNDEIVYFDDVQIATSGAVNGHWEVRVDMSPAVTAGDDLNAFGLRAHDGTPGSGGTELPVYYDSFAQYGANADATTSTTSHPWLVSGCSCGLNDFDGDAQGSLSFVSRTGGFTFADATLSGNDVWQRNTLTGWTSDTDSRDYGVSSVTVGLSTPPGEGNYVDFWAGAFNAAANPPTAQPQANAIRTYLATDAGSAPVKPYLEQVVRLSSGPNPPAAGQTTTARVTVILANPTARPITFSAANLVTASVPGVGTVYGGNSSVSQGSIAAQPAVGGTGNVTWNPGTVAAGATVSLGYDVRVTPASAGQRVLVTATPASGNGTRARYVDETASTTQARATVTIGPICELALTEGARPTLALVTGLEAREARGGNVVEWKTAAQSGTAGFVLERFVAGEGAFVPVHDGVLGALVDSPAGGVYRFLDAGIGAGDTATYRLVEHEAGGGQIVHGPWVARPAAGGADETLDASGFFAASHPPDAERPPTALSARALVPEAAHAVAFANGDAMKIETEAAGVHFVPSAEIARLLGLRDGQVEGLLRARQLSLSNRGRAVAWTTDASASGLLFWAEGLVDAYAPANVYVLRRGPGLSMASDSGPSRTSAAPQTTFRETLRFEEENRAVTAFPDDPDGDYWRWTYLRSGSATEGRRTVSLAVPDVAKGAATLRVGLTGGSTAGVAGEHLVRAYLNGTFAGDVTFQGIGRAEIVTTLADGALRDGENALELVAEPVAGAPLAIVFLDDVEVTYSRVAVASGSALVVRPESTGTFAVGGLADADARVFRITNPLRPSVVAPVRVEAAEGAFRASFRAEGGETYAVVSRSGFEEAARLAPLASESLRLSGADWVVVGPQNLLEAASPLAARRASEGLRTRLVDVEAVYDEFGDGLRTPKAIRDFIAWAGTRWTPKARYVLLAGAGDFDFKGRLGFGGNLLPPLVVSTEGGLLASDNALADFSGSDGVPDVAVGRIPARSADELTAWVGKVVAYESAAGDVEKVVLVADNVEDGVDFPGDAEGVANTLPAEITATRLYLTPPAFATTRDALLSEWSGSPSGVLFVGHGGFDRLAAEGLLTSADVPSLGGRAPTIVMGLSCFIGRFDVPGSSSLGQRLVREPGRGAAAVWAGSGWSRPAEARRLGIDFGRIAFTNRTPRLGDAVRAALASFAGKGGSVDAARTYVLLGDPALLLRVPKPAPGPVGPRSPE